MEVRDRTLSSLNIPKALLANLTRGGYEIIADVLSSSTEKLAKDINVPIDAANKLVELVQSLENDAPTLVRTAAEVVRHSQTRSTRCPSVDRILGGGLPRGDILEISGPPGSPKEIIAQQIAASYMLAGEGVLYLDCQNMTSASSLKTFMKKHSPSDSIDAFKLYHSSVQTLAEMMVFFHNLPILADRTLHDVSLLVVDSISFPWQKANIAGSARSSHFETIKQIFTRVCATHALTIIITSQMATKMLKADGSAGSYDTGARGIMVPQLGSSYLPVGRTRRISICPSSNLTGMLHLLPLDTATDALAILEPYIIINDSLCFPDDSP